MRNAIRKSLGAIFYVYILVDPTTDIPFYVGKGYSNRMHSHEDTIKKGKKLRNWSLYYKILNLINNHENITYKKVLENSDESTALIEETNQILKIGRADLGFGPLCNLTNGGEGVSGLIYTDEMRKLRSKLSSGESNPMFNRFHTKEAKHVISKKKRLRDAVLTYCHTKEHKESLKTNNPGGIKTSKPIYQIDLNGNVIMEWKSAREAARKTNISFGNISSGATSHKNWKPGGFFWRFTNDPSITNRKLNIT